MMAVNTIYVQGEVVTVESKGFTFILRVAGDDVTPDRLPLRDLAQLLTLIHSALDYVSPSSDESDDLQKTVFSLATIKKSGSTSVAIACNDEEEGRRSFDALTKLVNARFVSDQAKRYSRGFQEASRKFRAPIEFREDELSKPVATIFPDEHTDAPVAVITGDTSIYGKLLRVGGADPRAMLRMDDGTTRIMKVSASFARQLAPFLYREIGLYGTAKWETEQWRLIDFDPKKLLDYEQTSAIEAFKELAEASGPDAWEGVDVTKAIAELREDGDSW